MTVSFTAGVLKQVFVGLHFPHNGSASTGAVQVEIKAEVPLVESVKAALLADTTTSSLVAPVVEVALSVAVEVVIFALAKVVAEEIAVAAL